MPDTQGLVQRLKIRRDNVLAYIGSTPSDTELLIISLPTGLRVEEAASRGAMAEALSTALASRRQVIATHGDDSNEITILQII